MVLLHNWNVKRRRKNYKKCTSHYWNWNDPELCIKMRVRYRSKETFTFSQYAFVCDVYKTIKLSRPTAHFTSGGIHKFVHLSLTSFLVRISTNDHLLSEMDDDGILACWRTSKNHKKLIKGKKAVSKATAWNVWMRVRENEREGERDGETERGKKREELSQLFRKCDFSDGMRWCLRQNWEFVQIFHCI